MPGAATLTWALMPISDLIWWAVRSAGGLAVREAGQRRALEVNDDLVEVPRPGDLDQIVRREHALPDDQLLDLGREHVDAADDQHVVGTPGDLLDAAHRTGRRRQEAREVARAVAHDRQRLLGERREHQLALLARRAAPRRSRGRRSRDRSGPPRSRGRPWSRCTPGPRRGRSPRRARRCRSHRCRSFDSIASRIAGVHGSAPKMPTSSGHCRGSMPCRSISSAIASMYDGVTMMISGSKS